MAVATSRDMEIGREAPLPRTGVEEIDRQHHVLQQRWQALVDAQLRGDPRTVRADLWFLERYAEEHFAAEERIMADAAYPGLLRHRAEHERFAERIRRLRLQVDTGRRIAAATHFRWIAHWFESHIREDDARLAQFLATSGATGAG